MSRLDELRRKLQARTDASGKPLLGYGENVTALRAEIARLEALAAEDDGA